MKSRIIKLISALCLAAMMLGTCAFNISAVQNSDWSDSKEATIPNYAYSFAVVGDTQVLTIDETKKNDPALKGNMDKLYDWIVKNQDSKNIKFSFHMGDVTDNSTDAEWALAMENISKINAKIPNNIARGNHDTATAT